MLDILGNPLGGIGRIAGRPPTEDDGGSEVAVADGYGIDCVRYGGLKDDGGSIEPGCGYVGVMCDAALELLADIDDVAGV